jgi:hypothetical protein
MGSRRSNERSKKWVGMAETSTCDKTTDVGAYLLGGLSPAESLAFRTHADTCVHCSAELSELRTVTRQLSNADPDVLLGIAPLQPSPSVLTSILNRAASIPPGTDAPDRLVTDLRHTAPVPQPSAARVPARSRSVRRPLAITLAGLAAAFGLGIGSTLTVQTALDDPSVPTSIAQAPPTTANQLAFSWGEPGTKGEEIEFAAATKPSGPKAWAWVGSGKAGTYAQLAVKGLEPGKTYGWWFEKADGERVRLGTFVFPADQTSWLRCPGGTSIERSELIAIGATDVETKVDVLRAYLPEPAKPI